MAVLLLFIIASLLYCVVIFLICIHEVCFFSFHLISCELVVSFYFVDYQCMFFCMYIVLYTVMYIVHCIWVFYTILS